MMAGLNDTFSFASHSREIMQLHQFFEDWYHGHMENSDVAFSQMSNVMAEPFTIITWLPIN